MNSVVATARIALVMVSFASVSCGVQSSDLSDARRGSPDAARAAVDAAIATIDGPSRPDAHLAQADAAAAIDASRDLADAQLVASDAHIAGIDAHVSGIDAHLDGIDAHGTVDALATVDATPPPVNTVLVKAPTGVTSVTSLLFEFDATRAATFQCQLDSAGPFACHSPLTLVVTAQGGHRLSITATADDGAVDSTPAVATWILDPSPPNITITDEPADASTDSLPSFGFTADEQATFVCQIDGVVNFAPCTSEWKDTVALGAGTYTFEIIATDTDGGTGSASYTWTQGAPVFAGGSGTPTDPYLIATADQLVTMNDPAYQSSSFQVIADIDLTGVPMAPIGFSNDSESFDFAGTFDGADHVISNWTYTSTTGCVGLFGGLAGLVNDVVLESPTVTGDDNVGGLVGCNDSGLIIRDQVIGGVITSNNWAGGLVGMQNSPNGAMGIANSLSSATVIGQYAGGLVANSNSPIFDSYSTGEVNGAQLAGSLVCESYSDIIRSYASGHVDASVTPGGLMTFEDSNPLEALDSFWDIDSTGQATSPDGVGLSAAQMTVAANFTNWDFVNVWNPPSGAPPTLRADSTVAPFSAPAGYSTPGGPFPFAITLAGYDFTGDNLTYSIVTPNTRGTLSSLNGGQLTYTPDGWNGYSDSFTYQVTDSHGISSQISTISISVPTACDPADPGFTHGGDGSSNHPYVLTDVEELQLVHTDVVCNYILGNDIDLTGVEFPPISGFHSPSFDGNGHEIQNWTYSTTDTTEQTVAFFTTISGTVKNLGIVNINVTATQTVAGLAGDNGGTITGVYTSGVINSTQGGGGGLLGSNDGTVRNCSSSVTVNGDTSGTGNQQAVGGLIGTLEFSTVVESSATGDVSGNWAVGGLVGWDLYGSVDRSFATGAVDGIENAGYVGGLVGMYMPDGNFIRDSYATGAVTSTSGSTGALIGEYINEPGVLTRVYATGAVSGPPSVSGGLIGSDLETDGSLVVTDAYWDVTTTHQNTTAQNNGTAETDAAMLLQSTYVGFDFTNTWLMPASGYPTLR